MKNYLLLDGQGSRVHCYERRHRFWLVGVRELSSIGHLCRCEDMRPHVVVHQAMNTHDRRGRCVASAEAWLLGAVVDKDDMRHVSDAHEDRTPPLASSHRCQLFLKCERVESMVTVGTCMKCGWSRYMCGWGWGRSSSRRGHVRKAQVEVGWGEGGFRETWLLC